ncbi:MAG TPA: cation:proton antiporter [Acidimicrobiales bacterium]|nr:cation:proton antiporter [Acidimicrobiales bacterium]
MPPRSADEIVAFVLIDIAVIVVIARLMRIVCERIHQPAVVGEIIAGILLGPTLLGAFPGQLDLRLFPTDVRPYLNIVANIGLVIFMFIVGLELDTKLVRGKERTVSVISLTSVALPLGLGVILATSIYSSHSVVPFNGGTHTVKELPFALFVGAALAVTAFPVMARILQERGMQRTELGVTALAAAAVDDILAWSLLAVVLSLVVSSGPFGFVKTILWSVLFVAGMFLLVKPGLQLLADKYRRVGRLTPDLLAVIVVGIFGAAFCTAKIGIHPIFGAFLFGAIMPRKDSAELFHEITLQLEQVAVLVLLPVFFVVTGLNTNIRALGSNAVTELPLILLVAIVGKFVGATVAARVQGIPGRQSAAIGTLMNARGLTGLVILSVGQSVGVLDEQLFTMMVVMGVVTTLMTEPGLRLFYPDRILNRDIAEAERAALGVVDAYRVLVSVEKDQPGSGRLVELAADIVDDERPSEVVLTRFLPSRRDDLELGSGLAGQLGTMASSLDEMKGLARRAEDRGVSASVRSQFSEDPLEDLLSQATAVDADVLLSEHDHDGSGDDGIDVPRQGSSTVATLIHPADVLGASDGDPSVTVFGGGGANGTASLELALRVAHSRGVPLRLVEAGDGRRDRRLSHWAERIEHAGVPCSAELGLSSFGRRADLIVVPSPLSGRESGGDGTARLEAVIEELVGDTDSPVLVVQAAEDEDGRDLERLIERCERASKSSHQELADPTGAEPNPQGPPGRASSPARGSDT